MKSSATEKFLMIAVLCAFAYVCINCSMSFINFGSKPYNAQTEVQDISTKLRWITLSEFSIKTSMPLASAIMILREESKKYDLEAKGVNFLLKENVAGAVVPCIKAHDISLHDAIDIVCKASKCKFEVKNGIVVVSR